MVDVLHTLAVALKSLLSWKPGKGFLPQWPGSFPVRDGCSVPLAFPSPLDRIRTGRRERAMQLGLNSCREESFEANQSFPQSQRLPGVLDESILATPNLKPCTMDKFRGDALNTFSFSPGHPRGSFVKTPDSASRSVSFNDSWAFFNLLNNGQLSGTGPSTVHNPNKAVVTINAKTSEILVVNDMACRMFGCNSGELCKKRLLDLFKCKRSQEALVETHIESSGELVLVSGKVVDVLGSKGEVIPVSLWMRKLETGHEPRCLAVMEPVERTTASITFDSNGTVLVCDNNMASLHGYLTPSEVEGQNIQTLIPSLIIPQGRQTGPLAKHIRKQRATGRTKDGANFPLSIMLHPQLDTSVQQTNLQNNGCPTDHLLRQLVFGREISESDNSSILCEAPTSENTSLICHSKSTTLSDTNESTSDLGSMAGCSNATTPDDEADVMIYTGIVWVFANISGMITILPDGTIHSCNHYFSLMLLGYPQAHLIGKNISFLIPTFYEDLEFLDSDSIQLPPYDDDDDDIIHHSPCGRDSFLTDADFWKNKAADHPRSETVNTSDIRDVTEHLRQIGIISSPEKETRLALALQNILETEDENDKNCKLQTLKTVSRGLSSAFGPEKVNRQAAWNRSDSCSAPEPVRNDWRLIDSVKADTSSAAATHYPEEVSLNCNAEKSNAAPDVNGNCSESRLLPFSLDDDDNRTFVDTRIIQKVIDRIIYSAVGAQNGLVQNSLGIHKGGGENVECSGSIKTCSVQNDNVERSVKDNAIQEAPSLMQCPNRATPTSRRSVSVPKVCVGSYEMDQLHSTPNHKSMKLSSSMHQLSIAGISGIARPVHKSSSPHHLTVDAPRLRGGSNCTSAYSSQGTVNEDSSGGSCSSNTITNSSDTKRSPCQITETPQAEKDGPPLTSSPTQRCLHLDLNLLPAKTCTGPTIPEGSYFGLGRHRDGSDLGIVYQIKRIELDDGQVIYCLWVCRDPEEPAEGGRTLGSLTLASSVNSTLDASASAISLGQIINEKAQQTDLSVHSSVEQSDLEYTSGPYSDLYTTLQQIGKGAFGCVKMAYRNTDKLLVITKFIRKTKVYEECWVDDNILKKTVPLEVSLLTTLKHPNIVQVLDVFENDDYFQMVMEKHGCGMDLFEFIDRGPNLDEPLASLIFRQVVSAVSYLHSLNILHRDIKDENIILDERFQIKLIDFGSATFMAPTKFFSTFCGTVEYCSPEVLQGNKYRGPELEMWSLGVTLYTLIFGENPFFDVDETIKAVLRPPFQASTELMIVISGLLHPDPAQRSNLRTVENNAWVLQPVRVDSYRFEDVIHCSLDEATPARYFHELETRISAADSFPRDPFSFENLNSEQIDGNTEALVETEEELLGEYEEIDSYS